MNYLFKEGHRLNIKKMLKTGDFLCGITFFLLGLLLLYLASDIPYRPDTAIALRGNFFPSLLAVLLMVLSGKLLISTALSFKKGLKVPEKAMKKESVIRVIRMIAGVFLFYLLLPVLGFPISIFLLVVWTQKTLGEEKTIYAIMISIIMTLALYIIFYILLKVQFPMGIFFN